MVTRASPWDAAEVLELNRQRLLAVARERLRFFEERYQLSSDKLEAALDGGQLKETDDIGRWLFALHTFRALSGA